MKYRIRNEHQRSACIRDIQAARLPVQVEIQDGRDRTLEQNRLQRLWCREVAEWFADRTPEDVRAEIKLTIGVPLLRDHDDEFRGVYDERIKPLPYESKLALMAEPIDLPVTRRMSVTVMRRYLNGVHQHYADQGVELTQPPDWLLERVVGDAA